MYKYKKVAFEEVSEVYEHRKFTLGKQTVDLEEVWDSYFLAKVLGPWMENHRLYNGIGQGHPLWGAIQPTLEKLSIIVPEDVEAAVQKEYQKRLKKMKKRGEIDDGGGIESIEDSVRAAVVWDWIMKEVILAFKRSAEGETSEERDIQGTTLFGAFFHHFWC
jgi:hypothetical protein